MNKKHIGYQELLRGVPFYKPGAKILNNAQLFNIFPEYESLKKRIQVHRESISNNNIDNLINNPELQYYLMFDTVYSIMGTRGAGKTSALLSIKQLICKEELGDYALPVIVPEIIPDGCSMIGWILSSLKEKVEELDEEIFDRQKKGYFGDCVVKREGSLKGKYDRLREMCFSQYFNGENEVSLSDMIAYTDIQTRYSYEFTSGIIEFWSTLIKSIEMICEMKNPGQENRLKPLVYLFFDDVDLYPDKTMVLFSTIIRYLSHPNLVVLLSADESLILEVIGMNMMKMLGKQEGLHLFRELEAEGIRHAWSINPNYFRNVFQTPTQIKNERITRISKMYYDKILPPSGRYYLKLFNSYDDKASFIESGVNYSEINLDNTRNVKGLKLGDYCVREIRRFVDALMHESVAKEDMVFVSYNGEAIKSYLAFWGNTSRQLSNGVIILNTFLDETISLVERFKLDEKSDKNDQYLQELFQYTKSFARNMLNASGIFDASRQNLYGIIDNVIQYDTYGWGIYIDYLYLRGVTRALIDRKTEKHSIIQEFKESIALEMICFFIENIFMVIYKAQSEGDNKRQLFTKKRDRIHGLGLLVDTIDQATPGNYSLVTKCHTSSPQMFFSLYEGLLDAPETIQDFNPTAAHLVRNYYSSMSKMRELSSETEIEKVIDVSPRWFKTLVQTLYMSKEDIYGLIKDDFYVFKMEQLSRDIIHDMFLEEMIREYNSRLITLLSSFPVTSLHKNNGDKKKIIKNTRGKRNRLDYIIDKLIPNANGRKKTQAPDLRTLKELNQFLQGELGDQANRYEELCVDIMKKRSDLLKEDGGDQKHGLVMEEMRLVLRRLKELYGKFNAYYIEDEEMYNKMTAEAINNLHIRKNENIRPHKGRVFQTAAQGMLSQLEMVDTDEYFGRYYGRRSDDPQTLFHTPGELREGIIGQLSYDINNNLKAAIEICLNSWYLAYLQERYILKYLEFKQDVSSQQIQGDNIPFKDELYDEIYNAVHEKDKGKGGYLKENIASYIREAVQNYIQGLQHQN